MRKDMMKFNNHKLVVISIIFLFLFTIFTPISLSIDEEEMNEFKKIAFIYKNDEISSDIFKTFLESNEFFVEKIPMEDINTTDFSPYALIIIGYDTGDMSTWGYTNQIEIINNSKLPILGLGEGGYAFFGKLNLNIGHPNGWHGSKNKITVIDNSHDIFNYPYIIPDGIVQLYTATSNIGIHLVSIPITVTVLGNETGDAEHYPFAYEQNRYCYWGFDNSPDAMTTLGKHLFINTVEFLLSLGNTFVDDDADPSWYDATHVHTIQEGIVNASIGGTVFVYNGTYVENVIVDKTIKLQGESKVSTIINGSGNADVVRITEDWVTLNGFTIENSGDTGNPDWDSGLKVISDYNTISNNIIKDNNYHGLHLSMADNNTIENNIIYSNAFYGVVIYGDSDFNTICNCTIYQNGGVSSSGGGVMIWVGTHHNIVNNNEIYENNGYGIYNYNWETIWNANYSIKENIIYNNSEAAIQLGKGSENSIISNNFCSNNTIGISLYFSDNNSVLKNKVNNNQLGIKCLESNDNKIYWNNIISNTQQAFDDATNMWDNGYPLGGNYWDDYGGPDNFYGPDQDLVGSDGIGDIPYPIPAGLNVDRYPLMSPWEEEEKVDIPWLSWYPNAKIPTSQVTMNAVDGTDSYFLITLSNVPPGYHVKNGEYYGWCFEKSVAMTRNMNHPVKLCHSYDPNMPDVFKDVNWSMINYVINDKGGRSKEVLQDAIWSYIEGVEPTSADAETLLAEAASMTSSYTPSIGDKIAVLVYLDPDANLPSDYPPVQHTFIEVPLNYTSCNASFWHDHPEEWIDSMHPDDLVGKYFSLPYFTEFETCTLSEILSGSIDASLPVIVKIMYGGLLKEAIAGLLNTNHPCIFYPLTEEQIIVSVHDAFTSPGKTIFLYMTYEIYNLIGCSCSNTPCCPCCS
jgi:parallel beta-helix repeat protein